MEFLKRSSASVSPNKIANSDFLPKRSSKLKQKITGDQIKAGDCLISNPKQRRISSVQAIDVELASDSGVLACNAYELMGRQSGGNESVGYLKVDLKNYLRTRRQKELLYGEVVWLMDYFETHACEDPSFFYYLQLDTEQIITNIFWSDSRMIIDYGHFGDVISFDTTYKVVHGNRPFAIFLGMNNHRETAVFGAALMYDETTDSFVWLFETFLKAMEGKALKTIIMDQDATMTKALK
ncbi:protein FAR1-RELATED SEQUENCE 5-like [Cornus florida]|uniref:protein FAR1-RELATED SEQUENCE 5-like n=1 Tax=Cornus florida TaxID=4283 RepID=UPI00289B84B0|nr:protein FAR1-RELATED SEQUENCE 5-like [Cornus florida]